MTIITVDSVGKKFDLGVSGAGIISLYELESYLNRTGNIFKSFEIESGSSILTFTKFFMYSSKETNFYWKP